MTYHISLQLSSSFSKYGKHEAVPVYITDMIYTLIIPKLLYFHLKYPFLIISDACFTGISGKSQILFAIVYTTRYLDLFTTYVSTYNTFMKLVFIMTSIVTIFLMNAKFKATYDHNHDTFRYVFIL